MKRSLAKVAFCLAALAIPVGAFSLATEFRGDHPIGRNPEWPEGLTDLLNSGGRVYGYMINANDWFYFKGDTLDFNKFVARYAQLKGTPLALTIHTGNGKVSGLMRGQEIRCDWRVVVLRRGWHPEAPEAEDEKSKYVVRLELWTGGDVKLSGVRVPPNVEMWAGDKEVEFGGEIQKLIAAHDAKREAEGDTPKEAPVYRDTTPARFRSEKPLYLRVALNEDKSKTLLVAFDESGGTGKGYDVIYPDMNFDGTFERGERVKPMTPAKRLRPDGVFPSYWGVSIVGSGRDVNRQAILIASFPVLKFDVPYNDKAAGLKDACRIRLDYQGTGGQHTVTVHQTIRLRGEGDAIWEYGLAGRTKPSESIEKAAAFRLEPKPELQIQTRPDGKKKGNLGIGLDLVSGGQELAIRTGDQPAKASVEIRSSAGNVVHRGAQKLDQFGFG